MNYDLEDKIRLCQKCPLHLTCGGPVPGLFLQEDILRKAGIMIVGDKPFAEEDLENEPFVGRSRDLLNNLLTEAKINLFSVYVTYLVKCQTNLVKAANARICSSWLEKEIEAYSPKLIMTLGKIPTEFVLNKRNLRLDDVRGTIVEKDGRKIAPWLGITSLLQSGQKTKKETVDFLIKLRNEYSIC